MQLYYFQANKMVQIGGWLVCRFYNEHQGSGEALCKDNASFYVFRKATM